MTFKSSLIARNTKLNLRDIQREEICFFTVLSLALIFWTILKLEFYLQISQI